MTTLIPLPAFPVAPPDRGGRRVSLGAVAVALMLGLAGCGGGGSDDPAAPEPPAAGPAPAPAPAPGPAPVPTPVGPPITIASCQPLTAPASGMQAPGTLAGKASSPSGRSLTYSVRTQPKSGTVLFDQPPTSGAFVYSRTAPGRGDVDSFEYLVTDEAGLTATGTAVLIYGKRRIMPLGDSITDGIESFLQTQAGAQVLPADDLRTGYRLALRNRLRDAGYSVEFVGGENSGSSVPGFADDARHEGHGGATQRSLTNQVIGWLTNNPPDVVLLHIGTNDVARNSDITAAQTFNLLETVERWTQNGLNPPLQLTLATIIGQGNLAANNRVAEFNNNLGIQYAQSWATPRPRLDVRLLDMNSKLDIPADLSDESIDNGLHPDKAGYAKMAEAWFDALVANQAVHKCP